MKMISQKRAIVLLIIIFVIAFALGFLSAKNTLYVKPPPSFSTVEDINFNSSLFWHLWYLLKKNYVVQPVSDNDLFYGALKGLVMGLKDPYSVFLEPNLAKEFLEDMSGSFEGIGIEIGIKDERLTVIAPLPDTPAMRAGLRTGDKILFIDKKDTSGMSTDEAAHLIRGKKGTPVTLTTWRAGEPSTKDVKIIRDVINVKTVSWELMGNKIAYLKISHFSETTLKDFENIVQVIQKSSPNGLILDLRNNPGGYLDTAVEMAGSWLGKEVVVSAKNGQGEIKKYNSHGWGELEHLKTIVLVNQGSASASEILAGALQDYKQATILGEKTFGKGSVQELENLEDGSALKLTTSYWYTPLGRSINEQGIVPDIEVVMTEEDYKKERDPQLERALLILGETPSEANKNE